MMLVSPQACVLTGTSFACGLVVGNAVTTANAHGSKQQAQILLIGRGDSLTSLELVLKNCNIVGAILEGFSPYSHQHWLCSYYDVPALTMTLGDFSAILPKLYSVDFDHHLVTGPLQDSSDLANSNPTNRFEISNRRKAQVRVSVFAQVNEPCDVELAINQGCDGFGEIKSSLFLDENGLELNRSTEILKQIDKLGFQAGLRPIRFFDAPPRQALNHSVVDGTADNSLGARGVRLISQQDDVVDLFKKSLQSCSHPNYTVVLPMVNTRAELENASERLDLPMSRIGIQFETPMACMNAEELLPGVEFAIVGLNDLTQYTTAWDRNNYHEKLTPEAALLPQVVQLAQNVCCTAKQHGTLSGVAIDLYPTSNLVQNLLQIAPDFIVVSPRRIQLWKQYLGS